MCHYVHELGGFGSSHGTIDKCFKATQTSETLADEWKACLDELVDMTNHGKIKIRVRGAKRVKLQSNLTSLRSKTCEIVLSSGIKAAECFKGIVLAKWQERNPGVDPRAQGHVAMCSK